MTTPIEFPDVSFYQRPINWVQLRSKTSNCIIRAGQNTWPDPEFDVNWPAAKAQGFNRGAYWFFDGRASPENQWATLKPLIQNDPPETRMWFDWESNYGGAWEGLPNVVRLMKLCEQSFPNLPVGMYTGYDWFIHNSSAASNPSEYAYLKTKPIWIAAYTRNGSSADILVPSPWVYPPELHQFTASGYGPGWGVSSQEIDLNRVLKPQPFYVEKEKPMPNYQFVATALNAGTRIRNQHNTTGAIINQYPQGAIFEGNEMFIATTTLSNSNGPYQLPGDKWLRVERVNGAPPITASGNPTEYPVWVAVIHMGGAICTLVDNGPITPPPGEPIPPQEVRIKDKDGIWWVCTTFVKE